MFRISESFTICDPAKWERDHGTKPFPIQPPADTLDLAEHQGFCQYAAKLVEADRTALIDRVAAKLEHKMDELCDAVAFFRFGDDAEKYGVVFDPQEKRFWAFPLFHPDGSPITPPTPTGTAEAVASAMEFMEQLPNPPQKFLYKEEKPLPPEPNC